MLKKKRKSLRWSIRRWNPLGKQVNIGFMSFCFLIWTGIIVNGITTSERWISLKWRKALWNISCCGNCWIKYSVSPSFSRCSLLCVCHVKSFKVFQRLLSHFMLSMKCLFNIQKAFWIDASLSPLLLFLSRNGRRPSMYDDSTRPLKATHINFNFRRDHLLFSAFYCSDIQIMSISSSAATKNTMNIHSSLEERN